MLYLLQLRLPSAILKKHILYLVVKCKYLLFGALGESFCPTTILHIQVFDYILSLKSELLILYFMQNGNRSL